MQQKMLNQSTPNLLSILTQQECFVKIFKGIGGVNIGFL